MSHSCLQVLLLLGHVAGVDVRVLIPVYRSSSCVKTQTRTFTRPAERAQKTHTEHSTHPSVAHALSFTRSESLAPALYKINK